MESIISKLSVSETNLRYPYLINNVAVGLALALRHKIVIKNQDTYDCLKELNEEIKKIPSPAWKGVDLENQLTVRDIGCDALIIIEEMLYENGLYENGSFQVFLDSI